MHYMSPNDSTTQIKLMNALITHSRELTWSGGILSLDSADENACFDFSINPLPIT